MKQILVLLFLILPLCGQAQSDNYHGIVIDKDTRENIPYANVQLLAKKDSAVIGGCSTDSLGKSVIPKAFTNEVLKVSCMGYKAQYVHPSETMIKRPFG